MAFSRAVSAAQATRLAAAEDGESAHAMPDADRFEGRDTRTGADGAGQAGNGFISGRSPQGMLARRIRGLKAEADGEAGRGCRVVRQAAGAERSAREGQGSNYRLAL